MVHQEGTRSATSLSGATKDGCASMYEKRVQLGCVSPTVGLFSLSLSLSLSLSDSHSTLAPMSFSCKNAGQQPPAPPNKNIYISNRISDYIIAILSIKIAAIWQLFRERERERDRVLDKTTRVIWLMPSPLAWSSRLLLLPEALATARQSWGRRKCPAVVVGARSSVRRQQLVR